MPEANCSTKLAKNAVHNVRFDDRIEVSTSVTASIILSTPSALEPQAPPTHTHARAHTHRLDQPKWLPHSSIVQGQIMIDNCWLDDVVDNVCDPRH